MSQVQVKMSNEMPQSAAEFLFPQGIAGFPDATRYGFIYEGKGNMVCMQSIDCPEAAFILTPWDESRLGEAPGLSKEQCKSLEVEKSSDVMWMLVLNPFIDQEWVTANLKAPIALSESTHKGFQLIRPEPDHEIRFHWMPQPKQK